MASRFADGRAMKYVSGLIVRREQRLVVALLRQRSRLFTSGDISESSGLDMDELQPMMERLAHRGFLTRNESQDLLAYQLNAAWPWLDAFREFVGAANGLAERIIQILAFHIPGMVSCLLCAPLSENEMKLSGKWFLLIVSDLDGAVLDEMRRIIQVHFGVELLGLVHSEEAWSDGRALEVDAVLGSSLKWVVHSRRQTANDANDANGRGGA